MKYGKRQWVLLGIISHFPASLRISGRLPRAHRSVLFSFKSVIRCNFFFYWIMFILDKYKIKCHCTLECKTQRRQHSRLATSFSRKHTQVHIVFNVVWKPTLIFTLNISAEWQSWFSSAWLGVLHMPLAHWQYFSQIVCASLAISLFADLQIVTYIRIWPSSLAYTPHSFPC